MSKLFDEADIIAAVNSFLRITSQQFQQFFTLITAVRTV